MKITKEEWNRATATKAGLRSTIDAMSTQFFQDGGVMTRREKGGTLSFLRLIGEEIKVFATQNPGEEFAKYAEDYRPQGGNPIGG